MIRRLFFVAPLCLMFAAPALAQGVPGATPNPPLHPHVNRPGNWQRSWNANALNGTGAAPAGQNGASGSVAGHGNTNAFDANPANHANGNAFGTTAFGNGNTNAFGRSKSANDNANRLAGSLPTQTSHGKWFETGPNPPETAPRQ